MNKYICYYCECTYEGSFEYIAPIESKLTIEQFKNKLINSNEYLITNLPSYLSKEEKEQVQIFTLEDWFNSNKEFI